MSTYDRVLYFRHYGVRASQEASARKQLSELWLQDDDAVVDQVLGVVTAPRPSDLSIARRAILDIGGEDVLVVVFYQMCAPLHAQSYSPPILSTLAVIANE